jgi:hypothetical protein
VSAGFILRPQGLSRPCNFQLCTHSLVSSSYPRILKFSSFLSSVVLVFSFYPSFSFFIVPILILHADISPLLPPFLLFSVALFLLFSICTALHSCILSSPHYSIPTPLSPNPSFILLFSCLLPSFLLFHPSVSTFLHLSISTSVLHFSFSLSLHF